KTIESFPTLPPLVLGSTPLSHGLESPSDSIGIEALLTVVKLRLVSAGITISCFPVKYAVAVPAPAPTALPMRAPFLPPAMPPRTAPAAAPPPIRLALRKTWDLPSRQ